MGLLKLSTVDGFIVRDFDDAPSAGITRRARKILESSATDLARSATYTFAAFEIQAGGASAGLNIDGERRDEGVAEAIAAAVSELAELSAEHSFELFAGKGVDADDLSSLRSASTMRPFAGSSTATTAGVMAAASWAVGGSLNGRKVAIEQSPDSPAPDELAAALSEAGAEIVAVSGVEKQPWKIWAADVDLLFAGTKPGALNHQGAELLKAEAVVPWGPIPYTTRALAISLKQGKTRLLPDFVCAGGGLLAGGLGESDSEPLRAIASRVWSVLNAASDHADGPVLGACETAEAFLSSWRSALPFGRPMAS